MKRDNQSSKTASDFQKYYHIWFKTSGAYHAGEWMAGHVGHLVANVDRLQKQVKRLEKQMKKGKK